MSNYFKDITKKVKNLAASVEDYTKSAITPALPSVAGVNRAKKLIEQENYGQAKDILLAVSSPDALVYKYLGAVYDKLSDWQNAREAYQTSAEMNPNDKEIWGKLAFVLYLTEDFDNARKAFENADRIRPMHPDIAAGLGMTLLKLKQYEQARKKLELAVELNPKNRMAHLLLAMSYKYLNDSGKADTVLAKLVKKDPDGINTYEYALLRYAAGDLETATDYCQKSIGLFDNMQGPYVLLGKIYTQKCDRSTAMSYFKAAFDRNLTGEDLYTAWTDAFLWFGEYDAAREKALEGLRGKSDDIVLQERLALCDALNGATDAECRSELVRGILAYNNGNFTGAIDILENGAAQEKDAMHCYYLAKSYAKTGETERAYEYFEEAIDKNPVYTAAQLDYIKYLIEKEQFSQAQRKLRKMPDTPEFQELQSFVESRL